MRALRNTGGGGGGRGEGGGGLTRASGYNFPLFLVYPVDMPVASRMPQTAQILTFKIVRGGRGAAPGLP